jgi:serine/threonine protein kinase
MPYSDYRILGQVGQGVSSRVFCAIDRRTKSLVALKELSRQRFATRAFLRELNFLVSLNHPNLVCCHSIEYHPKARYLVTDYCEGGSLRNLLDSDRRLNLAVSLQLTADILRGLEYIHTHQVVHGDIKPENILLNLDAQGWIAKIADFGIAKFQRELKKGMGLGGTGSPAYMAPESFYGKSSHTSDLYAVGVILFELLLGYRPFSGTIKDLTIAHINQAPPIPTKIPFPLRSILSKALEKLPRKRFASATAMLESLHLAMAILAERHGKAEIDYSSINLDNFISSSIECKSLSYRANFWQPIVFPVSSHLKIVDQEPLTRIVTSIATVVDAVYLGSETEIELRHSSRIDRLTLPDSLLQLRSCAAGCFAITHNSALNNYSGYFFPCLLDSPSIFSLRADRWQIATAPRANWLITYHSCLDSPTIAQIWSLPELKLIASRHISCFPTTSAIVDLHHGLTVIPDLAQIDQESQYHRLSFCHRRGKWLAEFSFPLKIESLTTSPNSDYLFAIENRRWGTGLIIQLKPYQMKRVELPFPPDFVRATDRGVILATRQGQFALFDRDGKCMMKETCGNLGQIIAITPWMEDQLLISSTIDDQCYLHTLSF